MADPCEKHLTLQSRLEEIGRVEQSIVAEAEQHGFDHCACFGIKLSLEEALTNAIKHGNHFDPDKQITVHYHVNTTSITIRVCDEGGGFLPSHVPDPTLDENLEKPSGRGIMLMKAYMSEIHFSDDGKCVTMIKHRSCDKPTPPMR